MTGSPNTINAKRPAVVSKDCLHIQQAQGFLLKAKAQNMIIRISVDYYISYMLITYSNYKWELIYIYSCN